MHSKVYCQLRLVIMQLQNEKVKIRGSFSSLFVILSSGLSCFWVVADVVFVIQCNWQLQFLISSCRETAVTKNKCFNIFWRGFGFGFGIGIGTLFSIFGSLAYINTYN